MTDAQPVQSDIARLRSWRYRIFASTWLCYAGMYFCRKPFSIVKTDLGLSLAQDESGGEIGPIFILLVGSAACAAICLSIVRITKISDV